MQIAIPSLFLVDEPVRWELADSHLLHLLQGASLIRFFVEDRRRMESKILLLPVAVFKNDKETKKKDKRTLLIKDTR